MNAVSLHYLLLLAIVPFSFSLLIDVCFGRPADEDFDAKAIFFFYPVWLAKRRLIKYNLFMPLAEGIIKILESKTETDLEKSQLKHSLNKLIFSEGRKYFKWEYGAGMCPVCTNVRITIMFSLFAIFVLNATWYSLILLPSFSNLYLLIYQKLKQWTMQN